MGRSPARLLLVDDQEGDLLMLRALLRAVRDRDYEMDWAGSHGEAIASFHEHGAHDVYLIDYRLGSCTGLDALRELGRLGCRSPVIILTAVGDPGLEREVLEAGASDFVEKRELTPALLQRVLDHALERSRHAAEIRASELRLGELGTLAAGTAHEFGNLHALILGALERALAGHGITAPAREQLERVRGATQRAAEIGHALLALVRERDAGFAPTSLAEVVRDTVTLLEGALAAENVAVRCRLEELPPMRLQAAAIGQVVMNLLLNARDALRGRAGALIEVECRALGGQAVLTVADNGRGIAAADLPRIFEPFFSTRPEIRGTGRDAPGPVGTGIGLSLCRIVVGSHGGEIGVTSEPGRGSSFMVKLPLDGARSNPPQRRWGDEATRRFRRASAIAGGTVAAGSRVLVIEDEPALRELWREVLTEAGWEAEEVGSGEAALARLDHARFDAVLADLHLPGLSGAELLRRLRERVPAVVAISGADLDAESAALVDAALSKPVELACIRATLAAVLDRQRASYAAGGPASAGAEVRGSARRRMDSPGPGESEP